jgi:hypothetical protein
MSNYNAEAMRERRLLIKWSTLAVITGLFMTALFLVGCPKYNVWQQEMSGRAEFAKAEQNRRIKIEEAKANLEAEKLNAAAEVERAKGASQAIRIENGALTEKYIQYLWVRQQNNLNDKTIIYIPTEGNLPILEATRNLNRAPVTKPEE